MRLRARAGQAGAITLAVAAALLAAPLDTQAKGSGRLGGGGSIGKGTAAADKNAPTADKNAETADKDRAVRSGTHLTLRPGSSSRASARDDAAAAPPGRVRVVLPGAAPTGDAGAQSEEQARQAAARASAEKAITEQAAAEERAEAARLSTAAEHKKREKAGLQSEVEQVLERARNDYPVLRTEQGEPILRAIRERQKVLQAGGMYPSIAMVEAVADHSDALRPRARVHTEAQVAQPEAPDYSRTYGTCRWVEPYTWSCK